MALIRWKADVEPILDDLEAVRFWDLAATERLKPSDDPDWTAGALLTVTRGQMPGSTKGRWILLDVTRFQKTPAKTDEKMFERHLFDDEWLHRRVPVRAEREGGSSGKRDMDHLARSVFLGVDFQGQIPVGSKVDRAKPVSRAAERPGGFDILEAAWNDDFLDEIELFPDGLHDDQVDAVSGGFKFLADRLTLATALPETVPSENVWGSVR